MLWTDKLACLEIPPVIQNVNVLPSVISMKPFAGCYSDPFPRHSERSEESYSAQGRLREESSGPQKHAAPVLTTCTIWRHL